MIPKMLAPSASKRIAPASPEEIAERQELMKLWEEANRPGADKFVQVAKRKGIAITRRKAMHLMMSRVIRCTSHPEYR